jgi:hypothetical protein
MESLIACSAATRRRSGVALCVTWQFVRILPQTIPAHELTCSSNPSISYISMANMSIAELESDRVSILRIEMPNKVNPWFHGTYS